MPRSLLRRHPLLATLVALLAVAGSGVLYFWLRPEKPRYVTASVSRGSVQRTVGATGAVNPVVTVQVGSYVSGPIKSLGCDYNTEVVVGQLCAVIDPLPFQLIVDQNKAQVGTGVAQLNKDKAALAYAKIAFDRDTRLRKEGSVSQDTVDNDQSVYDQAVAEVKFDEATLVQKEATLKAAEVNLAYTNIVSPVVGTVITRAVDVGQTVAASLQAPTLFLIAKDLTHMQVDTNVSEADVGELRVGQEAYFTVQAFPGKTWRGNVSQIRRGPITVQNVVTYDVVVAVANPGRLLLPGMTADTHIVIDSHDDVLRVPLPAARFKPEGASHPHEQEPEQAAEADDRGERHRTPEGNARGGEVLAAAGTGDNARVAIGDLDAGPNAAGGEERRHRWAENQDATAESSGDGTNREERRRHWLETHGGDGAGGEERRRRRAENGGEGDGEEHHHRGDGNGGRGRRDHRSQVWVLTDGNLRAVSVTLGLDDGTLVEVSGDGLQPGDAVVVNKMGAEDEHRGNGPNPGRGFGQGGMRL